MKMQTLAVMLTLLLFVVADTVADSDTKASADANAAGATDAGTNIKADADTV